MLHPVRVVMILYVEKENHRDTKKKKEGVRIDVSHKKRMGRDMVLKALGLFVS